VDVNGEPVRKPVPVQPAPPAARPMASPARFKRRHFAILAGFVVVVVIPFLLTVGYL